MPAASTAYEFQRLHGMGEALYQALLADVPDVACRVYAPVGGHRDLLAYLVRRLLENGANSSFVSVAADPTVPIETDAAAAAELDRRCRCTRAIRTFRCRAICIAPARRNSTGVEFGDRAALDALLAEIGAAPQSASAAPLVDGVALAGRARGRCRRRSTATTSGHVQEGDEAIVAAAMSAAQAGFPAWEATPVARARRCARTRRRSARAEPRPPDRAACRARAARRSTMRSRKCARRSDFCRYYAAEARRTLGAAAAAGPDRREQRAALPRPRRLRLHQPVEFPARDLHSARSTAALAAGNAVVAKPAEQTPLIAAEAVQLLHAGRRAGERAASGARRRQDRRALLAGHAGVAGVAFTGSTEVARIDQPRARRQGRTDRAADRRDRRHQCHDRRRHRAAGAGDRRRRSPRRSAPPASAARRCGCCACRTTSPSACSR